ncbi:MAG: TrkA family potassium uptake protein [Lachnospiraceae bacterium]|nr:TrkA family potassium uptake protein [Lachnospiraceae bacterium]MDD3660989.1 TrkA family potassium uptake protein [Lachnospiraceae bacterium]
MKSILVIGMGRFGKHLARKMTELNNDVMIIDKEESIIEELAPNFTDAHIGDCTSETVLSTLGVRNFDICFVAIGNNFQSSLEITSLLKEFGAKYVVSKASRDIQAKFLLRNGADEVIYPEREMAEKLAIRLSAKSIFDFIELTPEYGIFEIPIREIWINKSIAQVDIRRKHHINILAIKTRNDLKPLPGSDYTFQRNDHIVVIGKPSDVFKLDEKSL